MENLGKDERTVSMAIRGMNKQTYDRFCVKIDALRKEFLECDEGAEKNDHVYSLTVQLFPVMKIDHGMHNETRPQ
jgi:hypothetical protein